MARANLTDGTSQDERLVPALKDGYFNVDEMRFEDLLAFAVRYAELLGCGDAEGDWTPFFRSDELPILAGILATNLKQCEAEFVRLAARPNGIAASLRDGSVAMDSLPTVVVARKLDGWMEGLGALPSVAAVRAYERIADLVGKTLARELQALHAFLGHIDRGAAEACFHGFGSAWRLGETDHKKAGHGGNSSGQFLMANFHCFRDAVLYLQESAPDLLRLSMGRQDRDPAIGLFVVFLKLFSRVQRKFNGFTRKHLNFYYEEVLKVGRREFVPDSAHLLFLPDVAGREVAIPKGTEFRGGVDEAGAERIYAADEELLVTDAKVSALHTLYLERDESTSPENALSSPGEGAARQFVTGIKLNRIDAAQDISRRNAGQPLAQPLFGDPQRFGRKMLLEDARVGFAVASGVLLLKQGQRDICITFQFGESMQEGSVGSFVRRLAEVLQTTEADAFFKAFRHMFHISLTAETGWLDVAEYLPLCGMLEGNGADEHSFRIELRLPDSAGAIVPYVQEIHGETFDTDLPVIKFTLNPGAYLYPYSLLSEMAVRTIVIEAEVTGCNSVLAYNQLGPLSSGAQFTPFGPLPAPGDYLVIGCHEAATKKLLAFRAEVEWSGLPEGGEGFAGHYRAYPMKFGTDEFKANLAVLRDRKWIPSDESERPETVLFESAGEGDRSTGGRVARKRRISFDGLCRFMRPSDTVDEDRYGYGPATKDGFFRMTLAHPPHAFGHKDYPLVLSQVMAENAVLKRFGLTKFVMKARPPRPLPNPPYTPLINSITIDYKAAATISLERVSSADESRRKEKMFHLHPLGSQALSASAQGRIRMAPPLETDGNLFIGLSASRLSGPLALFFHLRQDSLPETGNQATHFSWHYLSSNEWKSLDRSRVVSDTTKGFLSSGIVTLDIPSDIDRDNTVLPPDLFWLRVSANGGRLRALCSLYGVHANALRATWKPQAGNGHAHLADGLPAGTIKEARVSIAGIGGIRQIGDSFGGVPCESEDQWTIRVCERLKHKNRAVTPWDYERLVLQRFPEIFKVKCFPCMSGNEADGREAKPGHLLIVVIPYPKEGAAVNSEPMANALLLREVREFARTLSSAFTTVNVRNPAYERILVRVKAKLRKGVEHGRYVTRLNQEIVDYLSPWKAGGHEARFGWRIRCDEIQAHLQNLDYVEAATGLSLLRIRQTDAERHRLSDTVRLGLGEIEPAFPWGIAVPVRRHLVEVVGDRAARPPMKTGISDLAIGNSFILSGKSP